MPKSKLSAADKQEICRSLQGLSGPRLAAEVARWAAFHGVHKHRIYEASKSVRPERKTRSDHGRRKVDLMANTATKGIAEFVSNQKASPELATMVVRANPEIYGEMPEISLGTVRRYLRESGVSRRQAQTSRITYRPFEADFPGQIFQFDISGVKERWMDIKTRSIHKVSGLEVSKNHSNRRCDRVPVWKFSLIDDKSRKKFVRFVAVGKPNTVHVVDFLKEAFSVMGLPLMLYTDNDGIIVNKRTRRGASFLNEAFSDSGGFALVQHLPGNPQATGKVERMHQSIEEYEKLIGVKVEFGSEPTIDQLNQFADFICERQNNRVCKATGVTPSLAFRATTNPFRRIDPEQFVAAFKARDLLLRIHPDVTISVDGIKYQLSRLDKDPFNELAAAKQKIEVYWIDDDDFFACVTPAGDQYIVHKIVARADTQGEYKALPETKSDRSRKQLKASQKERIREVKTAVAAFDADPLSDARNPHLIVPGIDTHEMPQRDEKIIDFPRAIEDGNVDRLHELTYQLASSSSEYSRPLDLFDALDALQAEGLAPSEPGPELVELKGWLRTIFAGNEIITEAELTSAYAHSKFGQIDRRIAASGGN